VREPVGGQRLHVLQVHVGDVLRDARQQPDLLHREWSRVLGNAIGDRTGSGPLRQGGSNKVGLRAE